MDHRHAEMLQMVEALKNSIDGMQLHQQSRNNSSTSKGRDNVLQSGQRILGPNSYHAYNNRGHNLLFPRFNRKNLKSWLYRIDQYFVVDNNATN